jgi:hypothetical protein
MRPDDFGGHDQPTIGDVETVVRAVFGQAGIQPDDDEMDFFVMVFPGLWAQAEELYAFNVGDET